MIIRYLLIINLLFGYLAAHGRKFDFLEEAKFYTDKFFDVNFYIEGDIIDTWNDFAIRFLKSSKIANPHTDRLLALVHVAMHEALVRTIDEYNFKFDKVAKISTINRAAKKLAEDATKLTASHAAYTILAQFMHSDRSTLDYKMRDIYSGILTQLSKLKEAKNIGILSAENVLKRRLDDGSSLFVKYSFVSGESYWRPTETNNQFPTSPNFLYVEPFLLKNLDDFIPSAPYSLKSDNFKSDCDESKKYSSLTKDSETLSKAKFWWHKNTPLPAYWNQEVAKKIFHEHFGDDILKKSYAYTILNLAIAESALLTWKSKYTYNFLRPYTAIRNGYGGCSPAISNWLPITTTTDNPEYLAGHMLVPGTAAKVIAFLIRTDKVDLELTSDDAPGYINKFSKLSDAAHDSGITRVTAGIHWKETILVSKEVAEDLSKAILKAINK